MPQNLKASSSLASNAAALRLQIEYVPIDSVRPFPNQLRVHTRRQIKQLQRSIIDFGIVLPFVVSPPPGFLVTGSAVWTAAKNLGRADVLVVRAEHLTEEQLRLYRIADNRLAEGVEWNIHALAIEFAGIAVAAPRPPARMKRRSCAHTFMSAVALAAVVIFWL